MIIIYFVFICINILTTKTIISLSQLNSNNIIIFNVSLVFRQLIIMIICNWINSTIIVGTILKSATINKAFLITNPYWPCGIRGSRFVCCGRWLMMLTDSLSWLDFPDLTFYKQPWLPAPSPPTAYFSRNEKWLIWSAWVLQINRVDAFSCCSAINEFLWKHSFELDC